MLSIVTIPIYIFTNSVQEFSSRHTPTHTCLYQLGEHWPCPGCRAEMHNPSFFAPVQFPSPVLPENASPFCNSSLPLAFLPAQRAQNHLHTFLLPPPAHLHKILNKTSHNTSAREMPLAPLLRAETCLFLSLSWLLLHGQTAQSPTVTHYF